MTDSLQSQLEQQLQLYQATLRIPEWRIKISVVRAHELPEQVQANIRMNPHLKTAVINLMHPDDEPYRPDETWPYCPFETLAHEVAHILLEPLEVSADGNPDGEEFAINVYADMLLKIHPRP